MLVRALLIVVRCAHYFKCMTLVGWCRLSTASTSWTWKCGRRCAILHLIHTLARTLDSNQLPPSKYSRIWTCGGFTGRVQWLAGGCDLGMGGKAGDWVRVWIWSGAPSEGLGGVRQQQKRYLDVNLYLYLLIHVHTSTWEAEAKGTGNARGRWRVSRRKWALADLQSISRAGDQQSNTRAGDL